jgi:hypothetical protein
MSVKLLTGLGITSHPFDVEGRSSQALVEGSSYFNSSQANILIDHVAKPMLGNLNVPSLRTNVFPQTRTNMILPNKAVPNSSPIPSIATVTTVIEPSVMSAESAPAPYETIFNDFDFEAIPHYNFWVSDEYAVDTEDQGDRKLEDIPRYIKLVWKPAPQIKELITPDSESAQHRNSMGKGLLNNGKNSFAYKGVQFSPDHLKNFGLVKNSIANGHVSPGVIKSVVELPHNSSGKMMGPSSLNKNHGISEDAFLTHHETAGLSIHEIKANVNTLSNGIMNAAKVMTGPLPDNLVNLRDGLCSGKCSIEKVQTDAGDFLFVSILPGTDVPPLSFQMRVAVTSETEDATFDHVNDLVKKISISPQEQNDSLTQHVKVNFIDTSISRVIHPDKTNSMTRPEHAENTIAIAQALPYLEVLQQSGISSKPREIKPPSFPSPPALPHLQYAGYVIEKYGQDDSGAWVLVETIDLPDPEYTEYIDAKVAYGAIYRYRIKAILRWTRHNSVNISSNSPKYGGGQSSQTRSVSPYLSSYFQGEWSKGWAYSGVIDIVPPNPPDEFTVRPDSSQKRVIVTFRLPENAQRDISGMRLFRKVMDSFGNDVLPWTQIGGDMPPHNIMYVDQDFQDYNGSSNPFIGFFQQNGSCRYVYAAQCLTHHGHMSKLSEQLAVRLNEHWDTFGEYPIEFLSQAGVDLDQHGNFSTYPYRTCNTLVIVPTEVPFNFSGRAASGPARTDDAFYKIHLESLDTGEIREFPLNIIHNIQPTLIQKIPFSAQVPIYTSNPNPAVIIPGKPQQNTTFKTFGAPVKPKDGSSGGKPPSSKKRKGNTPPRAI